MGTEISISVVRRDATETECDVLVLKHAQALYGVDAYAVSKLEAAGVSVAPLLPKLGEVRLIKTAGVIAAKAILFIGVRSIWSFDYASIRDFACQALSSLSSLSSQPTTRRIVLTAHGVNYGLDESESFRAEIAGLLDSIARGQYPQALEQIMIVEIDEGRAKRLQSILEKVLPSGEVTTPDRGRTTLGPLSRAHDFLSDVGQGSRHKPHIFVAMPFTEDFDDRFHYGIQRAVQSAGFLCERADLANFVGDVVSWVRDRIESASFVVADLTNANPNVYLEVGYAWGHQIPTILVVSDMKDVGFDTRGQRCLVYGNSIQRLEELLKKELNALA
jgi:hypothetical protein